jgi:bla regulator protein BlaR1
MDFKLIHFVSENWLHAVGVTLFHSLWIGIVLSIITAVIILLTRKSSAALRYQLLTGCLCVFVLVMGITLYVEFNNNTSKSSPLASTALDVKLNANPVMAQPLQQQTASIYISGKMDQLLKLWNNYAEQIVLVWFLIICAKSVHLLLGLNTIYYLKRNKIFEAGKFWEHKLVELTNRLGIDQKVRIVQSGLAQVPMVAGHLKPLIVIPLGLLNSLSMAEVEAILCHELAHIKRRDYLVNLLQSFIEIVFFFNPAVLWLSKLIRTERENCCDDIALGYVADKKSYVKALLSCQEFQMKTPEYAMALTGKKSELLNRVSRMLFNTKSTLNKMEKTVLTLATVFIFLFSAAFNNVESKQVSPVKKQVSDTTKKKLKKLTLAKPNVKSSIKKEVTTTNDDLTIEDQQKYAEAQVAYRKANEEYAKHQAQYAKHQAAYGESKAHYENAQRKYNAAQDQYRRDAKRYSEDSIRYERYKKDSYPQTPISPAPLKPQMTTPMPVQPIINPPITPIQPHNLKLKSSPAAIAEPAPLSEVNLNLNLKQNLNLNLESTPVKVATPIKTAVKTDSRSRKTISLTDIDGVDSDELSDKVNSELLKDGIISQTKQLSYRLDKDGLYVNGKKQSEELHTKYKAKYLKVNTSALLYNYEIDSRK